MLDLTMIDDTIEELENDDTNFINCQKLASLYTVKQFYENHLRSSQEVESELQDILPQYRRYCQLKRQYQLKEISEKQVIDCFKLVCLEIQEFFQILYSNTDMPEERMELKQLIQNLFSTL